MAKVKRQPINTSADQHAIIDMVAEFLAQQEGSGISHSALVMRALKYYVDNNPALEELRGSIEWFI